MVGDKDNGVYNLRIRNVSLEDDAEFQCQVGPLRNPLHKPIRRIANLTVLCEYKFVYFNALGIMCEVRSIFKSRFRPALQIFR